MANLATSYMGLDLTNPIIVSSSSLSNTAKDVHHCEVAGAGAVVLKSIFEEQINETVGQMIEETGGASQHAEAMDYLDQYGRENAVGNYLNLVSESKKGSSIPIIASIHCAAPGTWTRFAKRIEGAGADGIELNVFLFPSDFNRESAEYEKAHFDILQSVRENVSIPVSLKIGTYFSSFASMISGLDKAGADAIVLFNRFARMDINIDSLRLIQGDFLSRPEEIVESLRWISILSGRVDCDLAASTGVHDGEGAIKQILAGATAVQVCSTIYRNGLDQINRIKDDLEKWMERNNYTTLDEFRGKMSQKKSDDPKLYERVQFMKTIRR